MPAASPESVGFFGPLAAPAAHCARRRGFTLVELLMVIGLIALLASLIVVGIVSFLGTGRDDLTRTRMEILNNMMAAFATSEASRGGGRGNVDAAKLPSVLQVAPGQGDYFSTFDGYEDATAGNVTDVTLRVPPGRWPLVAPGVLNEDLMASEPAAARTQAVLRRLLSVPANQSAYSTLSDDATTRSVLTTSSLLAHVDPAAPTSPLNPALIVDGHGNAIIFVPEEGLTGVRFRDGTDLQLDTTDPSQSPRLVATSGGSFWASAGPDGDFRTGDDNVYSTEVIIRNVTPP